jgi:small-conductance mechanosensitive channel
MNTGLLLDLISSNVFTGTAAIVGAIVVGLLIHRIIFGILTSAERRRANQTLTVVTHGIRRPSAFAIVLLSTLTVLPYCHFTAGDDVRIEQIVTVLTIAAMAWGLVAATTIATALINSHYKIDIDDNLRSREIETRVYILSRVTVTLIIMLSVAGALMTFPSVRTLGTTLLASAGLAGIAGGLAARPILENLIAGVQIAFTQPIRLDDAVIVETEFGRIEQITATYVVVRCWDLRRLIVPLTYFINSPFQNWTRHTADLIGTVLMYTSYNLPVEELRAELVAYVKTNPKWDGQVVALQVVDTTENNMQLRILVSAKNAPIVWDLRCEVREHLIAWVNEKYPQSLPGTTKVTFPPISPADMGGMGGEIAQASPQASLPPQQAT